MDLPGALVFYYLGTLEPLYPSVLVLCWPGTLEHMYVRVLAFY